MIVRAWMHYDDDSSDETSDDDDNHTDAFLKDNTASPIRRLGLTQRMSKKILNSPFRKFFPRKRRISSARHIRADIQTNTSVSLIKRCRSDSDLNPMKLKNDFHFTSILPGQIDSDSLIGDSPIKHKTKISSLESDSIEGNATSSHGTTIDLLAPPIPRKTSEFVRPTSSIFVLENSKNSIAHAENVSAHSPDFSINSTDTTPTLTSKVDKTDNSKSIASVVNTKRRISKFTKNRKARFNFSKYLSYLETMRSAVGFSISGIMVTWDLVSTTLFFVFSIVAVFVQESIFGSQDSLV